MTKLVAWAFGWMMPFFKWVAPAFTGGDDKASHRKLSSFVFMILICSTTSKLLLKDDVSMNHVYLLLILLGAFLLLAGIVTVQNIVNIMKNKP